MATEVETPGERLLVRAHKNSGARMPRLRMAFTEIINGCAGTLRLRRRNKRFRERQTRQSEPWVHHFGQAVSVISTQSTGQCVLPDWSRQQIAVTLNSITFQHGNNDRARVMNSADHQRTVFHRVQHKATSLFNGQVQHLVPTILNPAASKRAKILPITFCYRVRFDDGKSTFNSHFTSVNCSVVVCTSVRDGADYNEQQSR